MVGEIVLAGRAVPATVTEYDRRVIDATAGWLRGFESIHTRNAYRRDLTGYSANGAEAAMKTPAWLPWCALNDVDPLTARRGDVASYARQIEADGHSPGTRARKLSAVSSWYDYLISEGLAEYNPAKKTGRPRINRDESPATGLTEDEVGALLDQAEADGPRSAALIAMLYFGAFRIGSLLGAKTGDLGWDQGDRRLRLKVKGGKHEWFVIERAANDALTAYLATRPGAAPGEFLFVTRTGAPLLEAYCWRLIRRLARRAAIPGWADINPHSLRHTHITHALDAKVPIEVVALTAGHREIRTTLRYDRARRRRGERSGTVLSDRRRKAKAERARGDVGA
jgi:integrase/recombinase XerD